MENLLPTNRAINKKFTDNKKWSRIMFDAPKSPYLVPFDNTFKVNEASCRPLTDGKLYKGDYRDELLDQLRALQRMLAAGDRHSVLLIFQAMDAAGKDGTIRAVLRGVDPSGCQIHSFKQPSAEELDHDFLWRTTVRLPERGRIGIFNRSQYEEVLVVRVHPQLLAGQKLPGEVNLESIWDARLQSIREQEAHLSRNGTIILKFWLNVSRDEQKRRFLERLDRPEKNWKFEPADVAERRYWDQYMHAYEEALNATSRPWAPWYAIPADNKKYMRARVSEILVQSLQSIGLSYPEPDAEKRKQFKRARAELEGNIVS
jgi:PPK2 family polyphosphate:nucleotide phosphotransferase